MRLIRPVSAGPTAGARASGEAIEGEPTASDSRPPAGFRTAASDHISHPFPSRACHRRTILGVPKLETTFGEPILFLEQS
jgi:hypothetical protein